MTLERTTIEIINLSDLTALAPDVTEDVLEALNDSECCYGNNNRTLMSRDWMIDLIRDIDAPETHVLQLAALVVELEQHPASTYIDVEN